MTLHIFCMNELDVLYKHDQQGCICEGLNGVFKMGKIQNREK